MTSRLIIVSLLQLVSMHMVAQRAYFQWSGGMIYTRDDRHQTSILDTGQVISVFPNQGDTFSIITERIYNLNRVSVYTPEIGFEVQGNLVIPISGKFNLLSGVGFNYFSFQQDETIHSEWIQTLSVDTVQGNAAGFPNFPGDLGTLCDCYENEFPSEEFDDLKYHHQLYLQVPLRLEYNVVPGRLKLNAGAFAQLPLFGSIKEESVALTWHESEGMTKCRFDLIEHKNKSGDGIRHVQAGVSAGLSFSIFKNITLDVGIRKSLTNIFVAPAYQQQDLSEDDFRPLSFTAGVSYRLHSPARLPASN